MCGFHSSGRPKVWRTQIKPGTKFFDLFIWKNILEMTLCTAENRQLRRERSSRKKCRSSSSMVKTQCLCVQRTSLKDMAVALSREYLAPQEGQNLE